MLVGPRHRGPPGPLKATPAAVPRSAGGAQRATRDGAGHVERSGTRLFGNAAPATTATRTITIKPNSVTGGEIIRFDVGGRSFVWNFNGRPSSFDLRRVAPASPLDRKVTVYQAPDPMYPRRN